MIVDKDVRNIHWRKESLSKKWHWEPGVVTQAYNPSTLERPEVHEFETSLDYIVRS
jgi:hypothetical protein